MIICTKFGIVRVPDNTTFEIAVRENEEFLFVNLYLSDGEKVDKTNPDNDDLRRFLGRTICLAAFENSEESKSVLKGLFEQILDRLENNAVLDLRAVGSADAWGSYAVSCWS